MFARMTFPAYKLEKRGAQRKEEIERMIICPRPIGKRYPSWGKRYATSELYCWGGKTETTSYTYKRRSL